MLLVSYSRSIFPDIFTEIYADSWKRYFFHFFDPLIRLPILESVFLEMKAVKLFLLLIIQFRNFDFW